MKTTLTTTLHIDLATTTPLEMLLAIQKQHQERLGSTPISESNPDGLSLPRLEVVGAIGQDYIGSGIRGVHSISISGSVGDFGLCSFGDGECSIDGRAGEFFGHSIQSGILILNGHASHAVGALGVGGLVAVYGNAGDRVAVGLQGADIVIRGSVGSHAGLGMHGGCLIVGGNAGQHMGHRMRTGTIYLRGEAQSVSPDIEEVRLREPDRLKIGLLMLKAGIKSTGKEFRVYRPIHAEL